jgi:hypothetical protein
MFGRKTLLAAGLIGVAAGSLIAMRAGASPDGSGRKGSDNVRQAEPIRSDPRKEVIESPLRKVLAAGTASAKPASGATNPKVTPGKVRWHPTFADACEAARKSGKPVFLFHLMGNLDDQFC